MPAASHKGAIALGLVYIPVNLYNAVSEGSVSFNQLDRDSGAWIKYKKVRVDTSEEVKPPFFYPPQSVYLLSACTLITRFNQN